MAKTHRTNIVNLLTIIDNILFATNLTQS